jgi:hypothetical protein
VTQAQIVDAGDHVLVREARHTGRVHQRMDARGQGRHGGIDRRRIAHVDLYKAVERDHRIVAVEPDHMGALKPGEPGDLGPDARRGAGDDDGFSVQTHGVVFRLAKRLRSAPVRGGRLRLQ